MKDKPEKMQNTVLFSLSVILVLISLLLAGCYRPMSAKTERPQTCGNSDMVQKYYETNKEWLEKQEMKENCDGEIVPIYDKDNNLVRHECIE